ncbi:hypothetical protein Rsub_02544 [Raphidocelis subcapitata]|uniref:Uncharacterized protein n=1 Tax=Raphidocelis subcapitata TaxID=307507 RepID=A0A2V0NW96_9CHLO|nr:hypothetical protein Rsub_02544 [Raphidocelis subcapitata]|eukprot:GBF89840.1 hypothetical protein Rsub_02544 [Raphidocelis subcapitata]
MAEGKKGEKGDDSLEIAASHQALSVVAGWLGLSAEEALEETGAAADALFEKPRPNLLGLGAKFLSHSKAMETASTLDHRLKRRIERSADERQPGKQRRVPLHVQLQQRRERAQAGGGGGSEDSDSSEDEDGGGRLSALARGGGGGARGGSGSTAAGPSGRQQPGQQRGGAPDARGAGAGRVISAEERQRQLLTAPAAELSKWQRKRLRQKEKRALGAGDGQGQQPAPPGGGEPQ